MPHTEASFIYVGVAVFWAVLVAELIGDKTIYTVSSLALRFRPTTIFTSIVLAYSVKIGVAVQLGSIILALPSRAVEMISAGGFFASALTIGFRNFKARTEEAAQSVHWCGSAIACFTSLFVTEWGDPGQIVAAASSARFHLPITVWLAATLAMTTKATLALIVGLKLRDRLPDAVLRIVAAISLSMLGIVSLTQLAFT